MAIAALLLWLCTAAVGSYLLLTAIRSTDAESPTQEPTQEPAEEPTPVAAERPTPVAASAQAAAAPARPTRPARDKDRWDPPSLQRAKSEPLPGLRDLAEFAHPALAITGFAFWLCYVLSRDRVFAVIGLGILLGAICAGLSWFAVNNRAARRAAAGGGAGSGRAGSGRAGSGGAGSGGAPPAFSTRLVALHAAGAVLTVLFAVLIAARVLGRGAGQRRAVRLAPWLSSRVLPRS
jgi:hypothetical protein